MATITTEFTDSNELSSSEASAAEIISKMSEYQFIAVVQDGNACEPMEQVVNEKGEVVAINTNEYYETIGESVPAVELNFDGINELKEETLNENNVEDVSTVDEPMEKYNQDSGAEVIHNHIQNIDDNQHQHHHHQQSSVEAVAVQPSNLKDMLLPLGIKISTDHGLQVPGTKRKRPKSSLFIGCSPGATQAINTFDSLKERLQIKSNLEMLQHMLKLVKKDLSSTLVTTECIVDDGNKNTKAILQLLSTSASSDVNMSSSDNQLEENVTSNIETETGEEVTINILKYFIFLLFQKYFSF